MSKSNQTNSKRKRYRNPLPADDGDLCWGAEAGARLWGLATTMQFYHKAAKGELPGVVKIGGAYVSSRRARDRAFEENPTN